MKGNCVSQNFAHLTNDLTCYVGAEAGCLSSLTIVTFSMPFAIQTVAMGWNS